MAGLWGNWLAETRAWVRKGADSETATAGLDLASKAENRGNLGGAIP